VTPCSITEMGARRSPDCVAFELPHTVARHQHHSRSWPLALTMKRITCHALVVLGLCIALLASFTEVIGNSFLLLTDGGRGGYFIPGESSVFTFRQTEPNGGSGGWWIRGEDRNNFYAIDLDAPGYLIYPKSRVLQCPHFDAARPSSWCAADVRRAGRS